MWLTTRQTNDRFVNLVVVNVHLYQKRIVLIKFSFETCSKFLAARTCGHLNVFRMPADIPTPTEQFLKPYSRSTQEEAN